MINDHGICYNRYPCYYKDDAKNCLYDFDDIMDKLSIDYFLVFGSCMAAVRELDFILDDNDIDIAIIGHKDMRHKLILKLKHNGFSIGKTKIINNVIKQVHVFKYGIFLDLFFYDREGDILVSSKEVYNKQYKHFKIPCYVEFYDRMFRIPYPLEEYLRSIYGDKWETITVAEYKGDK